MRCHGQTAPWREVRGEEINSSDVRSGSGYRLLGS